MRGKCGLPSACVVVVMLAVGVASATAAVKPQTISVLEVDTFFAGTGGFNAAGHAPPSAGQGVVFGGTVYKWSGRKRGAPVGHLQVVCTITSGSNALCNGVISLASGSIELLAPADFSSNAPSDIAVVGGTGAYVGARGFMHSKNIGPQNGSTSASADVIHITG